MGQRSPDADRIPRSQDVRNPYGAIHTMFGRIETFYILTRRHRSPRVFLRPRDVRSFVDNKPIPPELQQIRTTIRSPGSLNLRLWLSGRASLPSSRPKRHLLVCPRGARLTGGYPERSSQGYMALQMNPTTVRGRRSGTRESGDDGAFSFVGDQER